MKQEKGQWNFVERTHWQTPSSNNTGDKSTHGHHHIVNLEIRMITFFAAKDGEALYREQKQDEQLIVAQIMKSLLENSASIEESRENYYTIQV